MLVNERGLPEPLYRAIQAQQKAYRSSHGQPSDLSVTQLIKPARMVQLEKLHRQEIVEDASDRIWAFLGTAVHSELEKAIGDSDRYEAETRLYHDVDGFKLSGQFDLYDKYTRTLWDYKLCSVWEAIGETKKDWIHQLNCLSYLCWNNGRKVEKLKILAIFRDWSRGRSNKDDYPDEQWMVFDIPIWYYKDQESYIKEQIYLHRSAAHDLPRCTAEDRWERPTQWAVMKKGRKSAIKLHMERETAEIHVEHLDTPGLYIQERPGDSVRCNYCSVAEFCEQRLEYL